MPRLDAATLASLYDGADDYSQEFSASLSEAIEAGFLPYADADEILAKARADASARL